MAKFKQKSLRFLLSAVSYQQLKMCKLKTIIKQLRVVYNRITDKTCIVYANELLCS